MDSINVNKWSCAVCTYENWPAAFKCTLCGTSRSSFLIEDEMQRLRPSSGVSEQIVDNRQALPPDSTQLTKCCQCTFLNHRQNLKCDHCFQILYDPPVVDSHVSKQASPTDSPRAFNSLSSPGKWTCNHCTYKNWPKSKQCVMCYASPNSINASDNENQESNVMYTSPSSTDTSTRKSKLSVFNSSLSARDRLWLLACLAIASGEFAPIERYVLANGQVERRLTKSECRYLNASLLSSTTSTVESELLMNLFVNKDQIHPGGFDQDVERTSQPVPTSGTGCGGNSDTTEDCSASHSSLSPSNPIQLKFRPGLTLVDTAIRFGRAHLIHLLISLVGLQATNAAISNTGVGTKTQNRNLSNSPHLTEPHMSNKLNRKVINSMAIATHVHPAIQHILNGNPNVFEQAPNTRTKWMPCEASPSVASELRNYLTKLLQYRKGSFACAYFSEWGTFALPYSISKLSAPIKQLLLSELCDMQAQSELEDDAKAINWWFIPGQKQTSRLFALWNRTAGDCLLDSALQACWCVFDRENFLRHALAESLKNCQAHFYPRWRNYEALQAASHYILDEHQCQRDWENVLAAACQPHEALEQIHIFALCHILRRPIIVYGVKYIKNYRDEPIGIANFQGIYLPLLWKRSFCSRNPVVLGYTRGHFSALVPLEPHSSTSISNSDHTAVDNANVICTSSNATNVFDESGINSASQTSNPAGSLLASVSENHLLTPGETAPPTGLANTTHNTFIYLPLVDKQGTMLPIHFTTEMEANTSQTLLRDWLDVVYTRRGLPLSRLRLHPKHTFVENMLEDWLNSYRNLSKLSNPTSVLSSQSPNRDASASPSTISSSSDTDQANVAKSLNSSSRDTSPSD